jgi:phosphopantothenoylcysteine decarboxylase/phosphopantothenate--cysteine ligase
MAVLEGKKVLLGVTAGIAAYKTASLVRLFIKAGAEVQVVMTTASLDFVTSLTLATLSKNPVYTTFFDTESETKVWNNHVDLALWADLMLIAPTTANTMSKMAAGESDNLLTTVYLSAKCPVYFAPAMDLDMYKHPSTSKNIKILQSYGNILIPATSGELASGLIGEGRMAEPEDIVAFIVADVLQKMPLKNKKILITAGPTYEAIDPVRFIGNHSSGKMGYELANRAAKLGAEVFLISGPSCLTISSKRIKLIKVKSAEEMYQAVHQYYKTVDIAIAAAAVADYRPATVAEQKIKKNDATFTIDLVKTKDILLSMGEQKKNQFLVGFALETQNEVLNAKGKLKKKNLDLIVLNSLNDKGAGFQSDTNKVTLIRANEKMTTFDLKSKADVAKDIFNTIIEIQNA